MKKIILLTFCFLIIPKLAFGADCNKNPIKTTVGAFYYSEGSSGKSIKGYDIEDPANKIILIFNHGGWGTDKKNANFHNCKDTIAGVLGQLSGRKIKGKELVLWMNTQLWKAGREPETKCAMKHKFNGKMLGLTPPWYECMLGPPTYIKKVKGQNFVSNFPQFNRANVMKEIVKEFESRGTPKNQIFFTGHSCGGMEALRYESILPDLFNATIALMPNCWDKSEHSLIRKTQLDEIRNANKLNTLIFHSEADGEWDYHSDSRYLKWMSDIPGAEWIELPKHNSENGKHFIIDGVKCNISLKMRGGWELKHDQKFGHKKKGFTVINPENKKAISKKDRGHMIPYTSCFTPYLDDIEKFIASKI